MTEPPDGTDDSEGLGREAGPDFAAPGTSSYGSGTPMPPPAPPQFQHHPSQYPPPGQPYPPPGQAYPQPGPAASPPPPEGRPPLSAGSPVPPPRSNRGLTLAIVGTVVVVLLLVVGVVALRNALGGSSGAATDPAGPWTTPQREKTPPLNTEPEQHQGSGFTFTSPAGWKRADDWGDKNDGKIVDAAGNDITVYIFEPDDPRDRCRKELRALEVWVPGEISELPDRKLDGKTAPGGQLLGEDTYQMRCASGPAGLYNISLQSHPDDIDATSAAFTALLDSWTWR